MFLHVFKTRLKCICRDKTMLFWTFFFPFILATLFNFAFSSIYSNEMFKRIPIAVVDSALNPMDSTFKQTLEGADTGNEKLFDVKLTTLKEAEDLLDNNQIVGYIVMEEEIHLYVKSTGLSQTIIKSFIDQYQQIGSTVQSILEKNPTAIQGGLMTDITSRENYIRNIPIQNGKEPNDTLNYFYALIAMSCIYASFLGLNEIMSIQANLSKKAARLNVIPVHKLKVFISGLCAALVISMIEIFLLLTYLIFVLKVDFGNQTGYILLTCVIGCAVGITFGAVTGAASKKSEGIKIAILIGVSMTGSVMAGLQAPQIKYLIQKHVPILTFINPVSLLTDAFYALYYYDTHTRYFTNLGLLSLFIVVFCLVIYLLLRRQKYESI